MTTLNDLGLENSIVESSKNLIADGFVLARVVTENRGRYIVRNESSEIPAEVAGKLIFNADSPASFPAVGDWVAIQVSDDNELAVIHEIVPRKTCLLRKAAGNRVENQIIAANVDFVFIMQSLDHDFNLRRMERYLVMAHESGAQPVILLSKSDLNSISEIEEKEKALTPITANAPFYTYSAVNDSGLDNIKRLIERGKTYCFVGSSGVGKSTLINKLAGENLLATQEVREDDSKGRHTTSRRQMIFLDNGGIVIDTPGMRELGLLDISEGIDDLFTDISELSASCFYDDCSHTHEPGCALQEAVEDERLDGNRFESYMKLHREITFSEKSKSTTNKWEKKRMGKRIRLKSAF